jgi:hypothetical protein
MKIAMLTLLVSLSAAAEEPKEMYMPNEAGGFVTLTTEVCDYTEALKQGFEYRAYATEDTEGTVVHEGCWISPSIEDAPRAQGVKIIPVVNTWWAEGGQVTFLAPQFGPEKKRWDEQPIIAPTIKVTPNTI